MDRPSPQPSPLQGALATIAITDCSDRLAEIESLFAQLSDYDDRFGDNRPRDRRVQGWQHPALLAYYSTKGYQDQHDLQPEDLGAIAFNLRKKLAQFQQEDQQ